MEEQKLPTSQIDPSQDSTDSLESPGNGDSLPVSAYASAQKDYPIENLEVHQEGKPTQSKANEPRSVTMLPFSGKRATLASLFVTMIVVLVTGAIAAGYLRWQSAKDDSLLSDVPTQDISLPNQGDDILPELQSEGSVVLINGDIVTRGTLKVMSGDFSATLGTQQLDDNQTVVFPNASGTICLDANNCNYVTEAALDGAIQAAAGITTSVNGFAGGLTIQGQANRVIVTTDNGVVTLTTPQDIGVVSSPTFSSLLLNGNLTVGSIIDTVLNCTTFANGGKVSTNASGQLVCDDDSDSGGSGFVTDVNSMTGSITIQGTTNQVNVASGAGIITISTPQDIATTSSPTFGGLSVNGQAAIGSGSSINTPAGLTVNHTSNVGCAFACSGIDVLHTRTVNTNLAIGIDTGVSIDGAGAISTAALNIKNNTVLNGGSTGTNYGIRVSNQTVGGEDYGVYIQGADTYALWVDSGISRFDGNLEFEGSTDDTFETTLVVTDPTADRTITLPNASGTVCLQSSSACGFATGTGAAFVQGGNSFGAAGTIGTNDANSLLLETNNVTRLTIDTSGNATLTGDLAVNGGDITSTGALRVTPGGAMTLGATGQAATLQGSTTTITSNGVGNDITLTSADQIVLNASTGGIDLNGNVAIGNNAVVPAIAALNSGQLYNGVSCGFGCFSGLFELEVNNVTVGGITGVYSHVATSASAFILPSAAGMHIASTTLGAGSTITNNYGLQVSNQTAGVNDYGVYIQGADTYALWVDSGATRLDGTLEVQSLGATDTATYLCRNSSNQLAGCATTGAGAAFVQGGNNFGGTGTIGLTSSNDLNVITNNATRLTVEADGDLAVDTNTLFVDAANNRVGVLTATPSTNLDVNGSTRIQGGLGLGDSAVNSAIYALNVQESFGDGLGGGTSCTVGCYGNFVNVVANNPSAPTSATGTWSRVRATSTNPGFTLPAAYGFFAASNTRDANSTITDNYGIYVQAQTAGTNDYGVYIQGADTAALWVDGITELNSLTAIGNLASASIAAPISALSVGHSFGIDCEVLGCYGTYSRIEANNVMGTNSLINNFHALTNVAAGNLDRAVGYFVQDSGGAGTLNDNYGLYVQNLTKGTNDYGVYIQGADTYALFVESGTSRFDGNLEFEGATEDGFELTVTVADPTADHTITLPNATGTVCLTSGNCAGVGGTGDILNNGQNGPITIGTNDATSLFLETSGTNRVEVQGDGDVALDTDTLFVDSTNNRLGVGTATPSTTLDVDGDTTISGNLNFTAVSGSSRVISGEFSDVFAGVGAHAAYFQNSATNDDTYLNVAANGSGTTSGLIMHGTGFDNNSLGYIQYTTGTGLDLATVNPLSGGGGSINLITEASDNTSAARLTISEDGVTTFNPTGIDADFSVQGNGDANLFYVDAGNDRVGIGTATPGNKLSLNTLTAADATAQLAVSTNSTTNKGIIVQGVASQSADLFQAQDSTGAVLASISAAGDLTVANATFNGSITVNGHIVTANASGSTTVTDGAACGAGSASISGNDTAGTVTINTGGGACASGVLGTVNFANAFGAAPRVVLTPANAGSAAIQYFNGTTNTTTFTLDSGTNPTASATYIYNYHVIE